MWVHVLVAKILFSLGYTAGRARRRIAAPVVLPLMIFGCKCIVIFLEVQEVPVEKLK